MNRKKRKVDGEKIFSIVASLAIVAALVVGVISVVRATSNSKKQNYIDLNIANNSTEKDTQVPTRIEPVTTAPSASEPATDAPTLPAAQDRNHYVCPLETLAIITPIRHRGDQ